MLRITSSAIAAIARGNGSASQSSNVESGRFMIAPSDQGGATANSGVSGSSSSAPGAYRSGLTPPTSFQASQHHTPPSGQEMPPEEQKSRLYAQFLSLRARRIAIEEGMEILRESNRDLQNDRENLKAWSALAVMSTFILIPLNIIVNALQLKGVALVVETTYQTLARFVYNEVARSGKVVRGDQWQVDQLNRLLGLLKDQVEKELKRKGLGSYVPGANILIGMAQDSLALYEAMSLAIEADKEGRRLDQISKRFERKYEADMFRLRIENAEFLRKVDIHNRTA